MDILNEYNKPVDITKIESDEQSLADKYILNDDVVLELGARYGSVSCIINSKLVCKTNQVVVEPDSRVWDVLERNKQVNHCDFHIVKGFVSKQKRSLINMAFVDGYGTTSTEDEDSDIPSFTLQEVEATYNLRFNVLVADCEGFLETFFHENPECIQDLRLVLFEADYSDMCDYTKVCDLLKSSGLTVVQEGFQNVWIRPSPSQPSP